ncbi:MAG TPA: SpoIIE family protein phosphatase [Acidimicrobiales bacterium]|nr:SpoIIE family protein phosphatase [Acidimicrobiales bacterium]
MTVCQAFVGSFGKPGMRDLDFGRQVVDCLQQLDWPEGVVVEELPCSPALILNRLQELRPSKVVLLGAVVRDEVAGAVRRYAFHHALVPDVDHTLSVARQWGGLPADTVIIEVEPADTGYGPGFSEELVGSFDPILDMVREELAGVDFGATDLDVAEPAPAPAGPDLWPEDGGPMADLVGYARHHARARRSKSSPAPVAGVDLAGRVEPWGVFTDSGGDWYDALALDGDRTAIVIGDVPGRGVEAAVAMSEVRAAVRAYAALEGDAPARVVGHLDRLAATTGLGRGARLLYLVLEHGRVRFVNAGGCPPLMLDGTSGASFVDAAMSVPVGEPAEGGRPEASLELGLRSTLLLYTGGLVESRRVPRAIGMERLRQVAGEAPFALDALCDRVLSACTDGMRRDDDICLLAVRP